LDRESAQAITDLIGEVVDASQNKLQELSHVETVHGVSLAKASGPTTSSLTVVIAERGLEGVRSPSRTPGVGT
jgi:hypothetical protein